eukprot:SAG31_NODE_2730_length_5177_cov_2.436392_3_plen_781_part_00
MVRQLERDPVFCTGSEPPSIANTLQKVRRALEYFGENGALHRQHPVPHCSCKSCARGADRSAGEDGSSGAKRTARLELLASNEPRVFAALHGHFGQFVSLIEGLGSDANKKRLLGKAHTMAIFGCAGLFERATDAVQTTARFVDAPQPHFVLDSPSDDAAKWYISETSSSAATHAVILARLLWKKSPSNTAAPGTPQPEAKTTDSANVSAANGKANVEHESDARDPVDAVDAVESKTVKTGDIDRGVHAFVVPLRRLEDGALLPGVHSGSLAGMNHMDGSEDVGYIQLTGVRVGPEALLDKYIQWKSQDGIFELGDTAESRLDSLSSRAALIGLAPLRAHLGFAGPLLAASGAVVRRAADLQHQVLTFHGHDRTAANAIVAIAEAVSTRLVVQVATEVAGQTTAALQEIEANLNNVVPESEDGAERHHPTPLPLYDATVVAQTGCMVAALSTYCACAARCLRTTCVYPAALANGCTRKDGASIADSNAMSSPADDDNDCGTVASTSVDWAAATAFPGPGWLRLVASSSNVQDSGWTVEGVPEGGDVYLATEYLRPSNRAEVAPLSRLPNLASSIPDTEGLVHIYEAIACRVVTSAVQSTAASECNVATLAERPTWAAAVYAHAAVLAARVAAQTVQFNSGDGTAGVRDGPFTGAKEVLTSLCVLHGLVGLRRLVAGCSGAGAQWAAACHGRSASAVDGRLAVHAVEALAAASRHGEGAAAYERLEAMIAELTHRLEPLVRAGTFVTALHLPSDTARNSPPRMESTQFWKEAMQPLLSPPS